MAAYREIVERTSREVARRRLARPPATLSGGCRRALRDVPLASLDHVDPIALLPDPDEDLPTEAEILPPRRARLVAVATTDGAFVDRTLVDAGHVHVFAVGTDRTRLLGTRPLPTGISGGATGSASRASSSLAVAGCHAVVATRFTKRAVTLLDAVGIRPYAAGGHVDEVLDRVARGRASVGAPPPTARRLTGAADRRVPASGSCQIAYGSCR